MLDTTKLVSELQEMREDGYRSDALLRYAVRTLKGADDRLDWVGVYLLDNEGKELWLHNYLGPRTEHAKIPVGQGVCGTAVAEKRNINVHDASEFKAFLADNPSISSELVVLIQAGDQVFGVLNLESMEPAAFSDADEASLRPVADKLAEQLASEKR